MQNIQKKFHKKQSIIQKYLLLSSQTKDIKEIIDEMEEGGICAVKCANESHVCAKVTEEDNTGNKSGFFRHTTILEYFNIKE